MVTYLIIFQPTFYHRSLIILKIKDQDILLYILFLLYP